MARVLFVVFVVTSSVLLAEETRTDDISVWTVQPSAAARLAREVDGSWFSIRPPRAYVRLELDTTAYEKAGIKLAAWSQDSSATVNPTITIMSMPAPRVPAKDDEEFFDGILRSLTAKWPDTRGSRIRRGRWNGRLAYRYEFSATSGPDKITGIVFADISPSRTFVVSTAHVVNSAEDREALKILEQSAISCAPK